mgnify:CR=1 FL=1
MEPGPVFIQGGGGEELLRAPHAVGAAAQAGGHHLAFLQQMHRAVLPGMALQPVVGEGGKAAAAEAAKPVYYELPEFLVNLNTTGKQTSFLKTTIILEVLSQNDVSAIEGNLPRLMDAFNTYLRELRSSDLAGSAGLYRLKEELMMRINKTLYPNKVNDVLFREILVQ